MQESHGSGVDVVYIEKSMWNRSPSIEAPGEISISALLNTKVKHYLVTELAIRQHNPTLVAY